MRVVVFAFCLVLSSLAHANGDPLLSDENGATEKQPVAEEKNSDKSAETPEQNKNSGSNIYRLDDIASQLQALTESVISQEDEERERRDSEHSECGDTPLTYAEFISCEDLNAQKVMADGTTKIKIYTARSFWLSCIGVLLLFGSFIAAWRAANQTKRTADAAERAEGAFVDIELSTKPKKFLGRDLASNPKMNIRVSISNYGNTPARKLTYKVTPLAKGNQPIFCEGMVGIFPTNKSAKTKRFIKDFASVDTTFIVTDWLMGDGTDFLVEWEYETIFSKEEVLVNSYTARFQTDIDGTVDRTVNTTHQDFSPWFERIDESESVRTKTKKQKKEGPFTRFRRKIDSFFSLGA